MSGLDTSKAEIQSRLNFYRQFKKHGFQNELSSRSLNSLLEEIAAIRRQNPHLTKLLNEIEVMAKKAKLAADLHGIEEANSELRRLRS